MHACAPVRPDNGDTIILTLFRGISGGLDSKSGQLCASCCLRVHNRPIEKYGVLITMAAQTYEFDVAMTCEGCSGAVERVLGKKPGVANIKIDLPSKKVFVTSSLSSDEVLECIKKTGKAASFVGVQG